MPSVVESTLLAACPSFAESWRDVQRAYPPGAALGTGEFLPHFRQHVLDLAASGRIAELSRVLRAIERLYDGADPMLEALLDAELVAPLATDTRDRALDPRLVAPHLGPRTERVWRAALR